MPAGQYQLVVARIGFDAQKGPQNALSHPWRTSRRHGVVRVERAPGVSRDAASRPTTPEEREAKEQLKATICEAWARAEGSASEIGARFGASRGKVLGIVHRAGVMRGTPIAPRPAPAPRPPIHEVRDRHITWCLAASWTVRETAAFCEVSQNTVFAVRRRARLDGLLPPAPVRASRSASTPATATAAVCTSPCHVPLLDASPNQCRSLGDDGMCCGLRVVTGRSWCPEHLAQYTQASRRSA